MPITDSKDSAEKEHNPAPQNIQYGIPYPQQIAEDTIDLYELWITLWNKKWLVIAVTAIAALGSVVYALQQPFVYKAEAWLLPPSAKDIQSLNIPGGNGVNIVAGVQGINPTSVFTEFKQNLISHTLQKKFILENGLMDLLVPERTPETRDEEIYEGFAKMIEIGDVNGSTSISIELHDAEIASQWVNDLINFIDTETILKLVENIRSSIANRIRDIEYKIGSKRQMAKQKRADQITKIESLIASKGQLAKKRRKDQINELEYSIASKRELAKIRREDKIMEIESSIASKRQIAKKRREDQINELEYSIASKRELAKIRREDKIMEIEYTISSKRQMGKQRREDQIEEIKGIIKSKREMASRRRKDKIKRYEEAAITAKSLGIMTGLIQKSKPENTTGIITPLKSAVQITAAHSAQMNVEIDTATTPVFFRRV